MSTEEPLNVTLAQDGSVAEEVSLFMCVGQKANRNFLLKLRSPNRGLRNHIVYRQQYNRTGQVCVHELAVYQMDSNSREIIPSEARFLLGYRSHYMAS